MKRSIFNSGLLGKNLDFNIALRVGVGLMPVR